MSIKIPQGREDLKVKLIELYRKTLPEGILDIVEQVQLRNQFSNTDEYSFRERVEYEMKEAVLEVKSNHIIPFVPFWLELDACAYFICGWLRIMELGLSEDIKGKIISEETGIIFDDLRMEANNNESYEVVRNLEIFRKGTNKLVFNKYVYTRL